MCAKRKSIKIQKSPHSAHSAERTQRTAHSAESAEYVQGRFAVTTVGEDGAALKQSGAHVTVTIRPVDLQSMHEGNVTDNNDGTYTG